MTILLSTLLAACTAWTVLGLLAVRRATRERARRRTHPPAGPAVSVLKPLCGADPGLAENLESFFLQDYDAFELVFGVEDPNDPAIAVVRALERRYPRVRSRLVVHAGPRGINPKVRNLRGMLAHASHDLLLVSDSNVRAPQHYVSEIVSVYGSDERIGLVTNPFAGWGERALGAALESVQLNGFCAAGAALPTLAGDALVIGKSMLMSRSRFEEIGGFERVANVLAEDFVIGKMFQHAGLRVAIAPSVLYNVTGALSVHSFLDRHLRWSMLRWRLRPMAYLLEPLTSPLALLPAAWMVLGPLGAVWAALLLVIRDLGGWLLLRGLNHAWVPLLLSPLRELSMLVVWARALAKRHIVWRGNRVRLGSGTFLYEARAART
jgi:ceramide glucosyltransferase